MPVTAALRTAGGKPGLHVARVDVFDPNGVRHGEYGANLLSTTGEFRTAVDFALGDAPGPWRVQVCDVATGVADSATVQLKPTDAAALQSAAPATPAPPPARAELLWPSADRASRATWVPANAPPAAAAAPAPTLNLLQDPNLLTDADSNGVPDGWAEGGDQGRGKITLTTDPAVLFHETPSVRVQLGASDGAKNWCLSQNLTRLLAEYRGKSLTLTAYFFRDKPRQEGHYDCDLRIRQWSKKGEFLGDVVTLYVPIKLGLWQQFQATGTVKPETATMEMLFEGSGRLAETFWTAGLQLCPAGPQ